MYKYALDLSANPHSIAHLDIHSHLHSHSHISALNMFRNVALLTTAIMAILAAAVPASAQSCNGGSVQCCNSVQESTPSSVSLIESLLGASIGDITGLIGVTCSPITGIGASGTSCSQQTVCCTGNSFNGVIALGCTPVNVNL